MCSNLLGKLVDGAKSRNRSFACRLPRAIDNGEQSAGKGCQGDSNEVTGLHLNRKLLYQVDRGVQLVINGLNPPTDAKSAKQSE